MPKPSFDEKGQVFQPNPHEYVLKTVHPQWGGYCSMCEVAFDKYTGCSEGTNGCFDVTNCHNGEFPSDSPDYKHYCDAQQVIEFGLKTLEAQAKHQMQENNKPIKLEIDRINKIIKGLENLRINHDHKNKE